MLFTKVKKNFIFCGFMTSCRKYILTLRKNVNFIIKKDEKSKFHVPNSGGTFQQIIYTF